MDAQRFIESKAKLLLLVGDLEKADAFFEECKGILCELALGTRAVDDDFRHLSFEQMREIRAIMGKQTRYAAEQKQKAFIEEFEKIAGELPMTET